MAQIRKHILDGKISVADTVGFMKDEPPEDPEKRKLLEEVDGNTLDFIPELTNFLRNKTMGFIKPVDLRPSPEKLMPPRPQSKRSSFAAEGGKEADGDSGRRVNGRKHMFANNQGPRMTNSRNSGGVSVNLESRLSYVAPHGRSYHATPDSLKHTHRSFSSTDEPMTDSSVSASWDDSLVSHNNSPHARVSPNANQPRASRELFSEPRAHSTPLARRDGKSPRRRELVLNDFVPQQDSKAENRAAPGGKKKKQKWKKMEERSPASCDTSTDSTTVFGKSPCFSSEEFPSLSLSRSGGDPRQSGGYRGLVSPGGGMEPRTSQSTPGAGAQGPWSGHNDRPQRSGESKSAAQDSLVTPTGKSQRGTMRRPKRVTTKMISQLTSPELLACGAKESGQERAATGHEWATRGQERAATGQEQAATGQERGATGQEWAIRGQERAATSQEWATRGQERAASSQERATTGQEWAATGQECGTTGQEQGATGRERATTGQEQAATGQERAAMANDACVNLAGNNLAGNNLAGRQASVKPKRVVTKRISLLGSPGDPLVSGAKDGCQIGFCPPYNPSFSEEDWTEASVNKNDDDDKKGPATVTPVKAALHNDDPKWVRRSPASSCMNRLLNTPLDVKPSPAQPAKRLEMEGDRNASGVEDASHGKKGPHVWSQPGEAETGGGGLDDAGGRPSTPTGLAEHSPVGSMEMEPKLQKVTYQEKLDRFIELYSDCLDAHLFTSLSTEIYFMIQLLISSTSEGVEMEDLDPTLPTEEQNYFYSLHNTVYFAVGVINCQKELVKTFDKSILTLLAENERLKSFNPDLHEELRVECDRMDDITEKSSGANNSILPTPFQHETNTLGNFPTQESFLRVKRLRDQFPELLKTWEKWQCSLDWSLDVRQVQALFDHADLSFYMYFARMFVAQLFQTCQEDQTRSPDDSIGSMTPDKSVKLTERLEEGESTGPSPAPMFPGRQRFYKEIIETANNALFNQHVKDVLTTQIHELNNMRFDLKATSSAATDKGDSKMDDKEAESELERFEACVLTLKTFARFLGFLTFMNYQTSHKLPFQIQADCIAQRQLTPLPLDVALYVERAQEEDRLALTVPWVAEFLAMMDGVAPATNPLKPVLARLCHILRSMGSELKECGYTYDRLLVVTSLGWLFEQPSLLGYYLTADACQPGESGREAGATAGEAALPPMEKLKDLVTRDLFYACCPYFGDIRHLLSEFSKGVSVASHPRKVNPRPPPSSTTPKRVDLKKEEEMKEIQHDLMETALRHTFPRKLQGAMEVVGELLSEHCVAHLTSHALHPALARSIRRHTAMNDIPVEARELFTDLEKKVDEAAKVFNSQLGLMMQMMLPLDTPACIRQMAGQVSMVHLRKQLHSWLNSGVSHKSIHKKLEIEITKKCLEMKKKGLSGAMKDVEPDEEDGEPCEKDEASGPFSVAKAGNPFPFFLSFSEPSKGRNPQQMAKTPGSENTQCFFTFVTGDGGKMVYEIPLFLASWGLLNGFPVEDGAAEPRVHGAGPGVREDPSGMEVSVTVGKSGAGHVQSSDANRPEEQSSNACTGDLRARCRSGSKSTAGKDCGDSEPAASGDAKTGCSDDLERLRPAVKQQQRWQDSAMADGPEMSSRPGGEDGVRNSGDGVAVTAASATKSVRGKHHRDCAADNFSVGSVAVCAGATGGNERCQMLRPSAAVDLAEVVGVAAAPESSMAVKDIQATGLQVYIARETQNFLSDLVVYNTPILLEDLKILLHRTIELLETHNENTTCMLPCMIETLDQLAVAIIFRQPSLWTSGVLSLFLRTWKLLEADAASFSMLCEGLDCLDHFTRAPDLETSLTLYVALLRAVVGEGLVPLETLWADFVAQMPNVEEFPHREYLKKILQDLATCEEE